MKTPTKQTSHRLAAVLAIATAFATTGAWAAKTWTGNGADSNWSTSGNWSGNGSGHIWFNSNISGTWNRLATINENTTETLTTMHVQVGSEEDPFVFQNNASFTMPNTTNISTADNNAGAIFQGGKFNIGNLYIGKEATIDKDATEGYLKLDSTALTVTAIAYLNNGKLVADNSTFTCKDMKVGNGTNGVVTIEKNSGDWTFYGTPTFGTATGSVVRVYHRGGSMQSEYMNVGAVNVPADVEFEISGGVITNTRYVTVHNGNKMTVKDCGKLVGSRNNNDLALLVGANGTAGELNIIDGGEVSVPNGGVCLCYNASAKATVNISNGGALTARNIWVRDNSTGSAATINLDGGIIRATADYADFIKAYSKLHIYIGTNGGTFDTAGHAVTIAEDLENMSGATGFVRFAGGGTATLSGAVSYTGVTYVDAGTKLVATTAAEKTNILKNGLEMIGTPTLGTAYTIFASSVELTEDDLANVKCRMASNPTIALSEDNLSIVVTVDALQAAYWTGSAGDNNLSTPGNWSDGVVPTSGNPTIFCESPATLTVGNTFSPDTVTVPEYSEVVTLSGVLTVNCLTNASKLAVASTGSLTVTGDLVATVDVAQGSRTFLYSNEGTVTVGGKAIGYSDVNSSTVYEYAAVTENTRPIQARGIAYHCGSSGQLYMKLQSSGDTTGSWVVGADGFSFVNARNAEYSTFWAQFAAVTLYSADNWTLANSGKYKTTRGDLFVSDSSGSSLAIDTSDYVTPETPRTVTLKGRIVAYNPVTIKGCGTVVVDTTGSREHEYLPEVFRHTCLTNAATLSVTDTATLQINAGKKITGNGTISLAAGTTLALGSTDREFATPDIVPVTLPETGKATIKIDGERLRSSVDFTVCSLADLPEGYNVADHVTVTGTALGGRKYEVKAVEVAENETTVTKLVLNIEPTGAMVIVF